VSMTNIGVEDDSNALAKYKWTEVASRFAKEWGPRLLAALREEAPVAADGGGRLRDRLHFEFHAPIGSMTMLFTDDVPYFDYVIKGTTGGQVITPVAARALHWSSGGSDVFAMSVTRGDTPANDFPSRVWDRMAEEVQTGFRNLIRESLT